MFWLRRGGGYCSTCFPLPSLGCLYTCCPGVRVWAKPHAPECPSGPHAVASTKPGPSTDRKVNSKMIGYGKWTEVLAWPELFTWLLPFRIFSTNQTEPTRMHFLQSKPTLLRVYLVWDHTLSFSQVALSAKAGLISVRSTLLLHPTEGKSLLQSTVHLILKKASTSVSSFPSLTFVASLVQDMHILQVWKATQNHNLKFTWKYQRNSTCPLALCH